MAQNYTSSGTLWVFGDSVGRLLYKSVNTRPEKLYKELEGDLDFRPEKVHEVVIDVLRKPEMQQEESTLLLNLAVHYVRSINFTTYQKLIDDLILVLKAKGLLEYSAKIIWKSSTAVCMEKYAKGILTHFRFMTSQVCLHFVMS